MSNIPDDVVDKMADIIRKLALDSTTYNLIPLDWIVEARQIYGSLPPPPDPQKEEVRRVASEMGLADVHPLDDNPSWQRQSTAGLALRCLRRGIEIGRNPSHPANKESST